MGCIMISPVLISTTEKYNPLSIAIRIITKGQYSHTALGFRIDVEGMSELKEFYGMLLPADFDTVLPQDSTQWPIFYFESILKKDKRTGRSGVRGPYWTSKIQEWSASKPGNIFAVDDIADIPESDTWQSLEKAFRMVGKYDYDLMQLFMNYRGIARGVGIPCARRNKDKVTCSEFASVCLPVWWMALHADLGYVLYEEYPPDGPNHGLHQIVRRVNEMNISKQARSKRP